MLSARNLSGVIDEVIFTGPRSSLLGVCRALVYYDVYLGIRKQRHDALRVAASRQPTAEHERGARQRGKGETPAAKSERASSLW